MSEAGFVNMTGIDPYLPEDRHFDGGSRILRRAIEEMDGQFDLIMLHHSFEHVPDPHATLQHIKRLLSPSGTAILRMPVAGSFAWKEYRAHWAQLDPPRHLHVQTPKSMRMLAESNGFAVSRIDMDSTGFQFWASEQYRRDIPLNDPRSEAVSSANSIFSRREMRAYERRAEYLNRTGDADSACFYLQLAH
jgi:SAM-dependent methyltransferase